VSEVEMKMDPVLHEVSKQLQELKKDINASQEILKKDIRAGQEEIKKCQQGRTYKWCKYLTRPTGSPSK
jgi:hypothetical protein